VSSLRPVARSLLQVARDVLQDLDVDVVLGRVLEAARELTGARYAALGVLNDSRTGLARFVTAGIDEATRREIGPLPTGHGLLGELIRDPVPLRCAEVGRHPRSYGFPVGHPPMTTFLGVPVLIRGEPFGNLYLTDKQGSGEFTDADEEALVVLAEFAGVAIDHARRYSGSEARRDELQRTVATLDATVQISRTLAGQTDLGSILELVAKRGRALVSARTLFIELERNGELVVAAGAGEFPAEMVGRRFAIEGSVAGAAQRSRRPQRLENELNRARFAEQGLGTLGLRPAGGLIVPLLFSGRGYGALVALDRLEGGPQFTADDERLLEAFATSAAAAVATAESAAVERAAQRLAAAEEERGRWARELHDDSLQSLAALRLSLSAARRTGKAEVLDEAIGDAIDGLASEIANLRALITELRPAALDQLGVEPAIEALAERVTRSGLEVVANTDLAYEGQRASERLVAELETAVYRIVQEALTNARKHAGATRAVVDVVERDLTVEISVRDNGSGFDPSAATAGFGLIGMRERAELLDGVLQILSAPGEGTVVRATLPVRRRGAPTGLGAVRGRETG
jgi:signal transduction histidine kinase